MNKFFFLIAAALLLGSVSCKKESVGFKTEELKDFSVEELVMMGRIPYIPRFKPRSGQDIEVVEWALENVHLKEYRNRMINTLSGGEKQRVSIAQALAQQPSLLILDEPTAFLDLNHQMEIMELLQDLNRNHGICVFLTSHDLNLAALFGSRLIIMKDGTFTI